MKTRNMMLWGVASAALAVTGAWAGAKNSVQVTVDTVAREAYGALGTARGTADTTQYIGCQVYAYSSSTPVAFCSARNAAGTGGSCTSSNTTIIDSARAVNGDSYVYFNWDASGNCTYLLVVNNSLYAPKQP